MTPDGLPPLSPTEQQRLLAETSALAEALAETLRTHVATQAGGVLSVQAVLEGAALFAAWALDLCTRELGDAETTQAQMLLHLQTHIAVMMQTIRQQRRQRTEEST